MSNYIKREEWRGGSDDLRMPSNALSPAPAAQSPIQAELHELRIVLEELEKQHHELVDRLRPVCISDTPNNKPTDGIAAELSTGCDLKDRIAEIKQHVLFIKRLTNQLIDKLYV